MSRAEAIATKCRQCIYDPIAAGTWREQVATCGCPDCPLWSYRPLPRNSPPWLASREPSDLPVGFANLHHDDAVTTLRGNIAAKANRARVSRAPLDTEGLPGSGVAP